MKQNQAKTVVQVLKAARWMLENVGWNQHQNAVVQYVGDDEGCQEVYKSFCAFGAISHVEKPGHRLTDAAIARLQSHIGGNSIVLWNDAKNRTKDQVLDLFDKAIKGKKS
jgi:tetrahydrodipicolinate N-succinyltransferase